MSWSASAIYYLGLFDVATIMVGGMITAFVILVGWDAQKLWERVWPATGVLIGSNIAAALLLWAVAKLVV